MGLFDRFRRIPKANPKDAVSVGGTAVVGGRPTSDEISTEWANPTTRYKRQKEIAYNIDIVSAGILATRRLCSGVKWAAVPPKNLQGGSDSDAKLYADLVTEMLYDMGQPWPSVVADAAMHPYMGFAIQTTQAKLREDGIYGLENLWTVPQNTVQQWLTDEVGMITGIIQRSPADGFKERAIARNRMCHFVHKLITDTPEGTGIIRLCAQGAKFLDLFQRVEGIGFENDLRGVPMAKAPLAELRALIGQNVPGSKPARKYTEADITEALSGITAFLEGHVRTNDLGVLLDSEVFKNPDGTLTSVGKWMIETIHSDASAAEAIGAAIERWTRAIARILGVEHMLLGGDGSGSLALGREKILMFKLLVDSMLEYMAWVYKQDALRAFIWPLNGWDPRLVPDLMPQAVALRDVKEQLDALESLNRSGTKKKDPALDIIRAAVDLPPAPDEDPEDLIGGIDIPLDDLGGDPNPADPSAPPIEPPANDAPGGPARPGQRQDEPGSPPQRSAA